MKYIVKDFDTRYYAGIELIGGFRIGSDGHKKLPGLWEELENVYLDDIPNKKDPLHFVGLEIYRVDFAETKMVDYYALVETDGLIGLDDDNNLVTKKLPKGSYMMFPIDKNNLVNDIKKVYRYIEQEAFNIHIGFHVEDYTYFQERKDDKTLYLCFKLEE